ncbi:MAG: glycoside hydrolase family 97 protein [Bacteroidales bacterium]|nr:glycoside hydrolase family 97 protein [Candidatus Cryptobacteroides aphodequi]
MGKRYFALALAAVLALASCSPRVALETTLDSPSGVLQLSFGISAKGEPQYSLGRQDEAVVLPSRLGFTLRKENSKSLDMFDRGFEVDTVIYDAFDGSWETVWGEERTIRNNYREMLVRLVQKDSDRRLDIRFRLFDDGLGFRYEFPAGANLAKFVIMEELSEFAMAGDHTAWWIPADYDTQEYCYTTSRLSEIDNLFEETVAKNDAVVPFSKHAVQTSLQMRSESGLYINLHEAALVDYPCMHLLYDEKTKVFRSCLTPDVLGRKGYMQSPCTTPWRTVQVAASAEEQLASRLILNLNEPCALESTDWIHPVKYVGVWWEMISGAGDWSYTSQSEPFRLEDFDYAAAEPHGRHPANNANVRRYIDFAAENGFDAVLVEGWNLGWEDWCACKKEHIFDFCTPYPDFDIAALNAYAHSKGVKLIMHHETSSSVRDYERQMEDAYCLMNRYGYDAVKSGYVGTIQPFGETHYGQWMVNHYLYAVTEAARHHIMVNAHEAVRPTGLCRTYPNLIGNESARGTEHQAFGGTEPEHTTILQFTRLNGGPMDFTPGIFEQDLTLAGGKPSPVLATIANQLSLYVTMYSPLQMAADLPQNYVRFMDAFQFIRDVAADWEESRYLAAAPGDYVVIARRPRQESLSGSARDFSFGRDTWFVGGTTDENARTIEVDFSFLSPGTTYEAVIYADAPDAHYRTNPQAYTITRTELRSGDRLPLSMAPGGGFAIELRAK